MSQGQEYWDGLFSSRSWGRYPPEELVRFVSRQYGRDPKKSDIRILEVGTGPGPNIWYLVREGFSVAGIDGSPTAIKQSIERLRYENLPNSLPQVDLRVGDFSSLPWGDDFFDAVIDVESIYANTFSVIEKTIFEVHRTLKPGGFFFGKMFSAESTGSDTGVIIEMNTASMPTIGPCKGNETAHFFTIEELMYLFKTFSNLSVDRIVRTDAGGQIKVVEWLVTSCK